MSDKQNKVIISRISEDLDIDASDSLSDEEMIRLISARVEKMLAGDPDLLMSYLYRLDIEQDKIEHAIALSPLPLPLSFAQLIWERQKQRIITKAKYKQNPIEGWEF